LADEALVIFDDVMDAPGATVNMVKACAEIVGSGPYKVVKDAGMLHKSIPMVFMRFVR